MTNSKRAVLGLIILLLIINAGCAGVPRARRFKSGESGIVRPPTEFVGPLTKKVWEGEIRGRWVVYFRSKEANKVEDVITITEDNLPKRFKRIEYFDKGGDETIDLVKIKIYQEGKGWEDKEIGEGNMAGLAQANNIYKELIATIKEVQAQEAERLLK